MFTLCLSNASKQRESILARLTKSTDGSLASGETNLLRISNGFLMTRSSPETYLFHCRRDIFGNLQGVVLVEGHLVFDNTPSSAKDLASRLLDAWENEGTEFLHKLEGSYSLIMHDEENQTTLVATDCMASRMLWINEADGATTIGTDLSLIACSMSQVRKFDNVHLWGLIHYGRAISDRTVFRHIRSIYAGQVLHFKQGSLVRKGQYFEPVFRPNPNGKAQDLGAQLNDCLSKTIADACSDAHSPSLFLSGGLDSRLLAALCPRNVVAVTLCDQINTEVRIAQAIARRTGHCHRVVFRDPDWYVTVMEQAPIRYSAMWGWNEAHYLPLGYEGISFEHDVAMLGFGCDTYFKGNNLKWDRLWSGWHAHAGPEPTAEEFLNIISEAPYCNPNYTNIFQDSFIAQAEEEFRAVAMDEIRRVQQWASYIPDIWELFWGHELVRVPETLNLVCLREFTSERNIFSTLRVRQLSLTIPANVRASGDIVRSALKLVGGGLASMPDASSMLPAWAPHKYHRGSIKVRQKLSVMRGWMLSKRKSTSVAGQCAWTRFDRLLVVNDRIRGYLHELIEDAHALPEDIFDRGKIRNLIQRHMNGEVDNSMQINLLLTWGAHSRHIQHSGKYE